MHTMKTTLRSLLALAILASTMFAQGPAAPVKSSRQVPPDQNPAAKAFGDQAITLRPPKGEKVAIIMFEDLECPDCARAHPLILEAKKAYNIAVVAHNFPLPMHPWSFQAAIYAVFFKHISDKLDAGWRDYCFTNQPSINGDNLRQYAETFAKANNVKLPIVIDPNDKLAKEVKDDYALGLRLGVTYTPTLWVVNNNPASKNDAPFVEVLPDRSNLFQLIDELKAKAK